MGTVPTPAELSQMLHDLGVAMGQLTTQVANMSTTANTSVHTAARATKLAVALSRNSPHKTYFMETQRRRSWAWPIW